VTLQRLKDGDPSNHRNRIKQRRIKLKPEIELIRNYRWIKEVENLSILIHPNTPQIALE